MADVHHRALRHRGHRLSLRRDRAARADRWGSRPRQRCGRRRTGDRRAGHAARAGAVGARDPTAWAAAIERDDGAAFVALIDPTYGVTVSYHFGMGDQLEDLVHVAGGASGPPSRMIGQQGPRTCRRSGLGAAGRAWPCMIQTYLADARVDPSDVMGFMYGSCGTGRPESNPPMAAYLRHDRSDAGYHAFDDDIDGGPPVPPLTGPHRVRPRADGDYAAAQRRGLAGRARHLRRTLRERTGLADRAGTRADVGSDSEGLRGGRREFLGGTHVATYDDSPAGVGRAVRQRSVLR